MSVIGVQVINNIIQASFIVTKTLQDNVTRLMETVEHRSGAMYSIGYPSETHLKLKSCAVSFAHNQFSGARLFLNFAQSTAVCRALWVVGLAETVLKAQAPLAAILESKMAASTLPVAILD